MSQDYVLLVLLILAVMSCVNSSTTPETMTDTFPTTSDTSTSTVNASTTPGAKTVSPSTETTETTAFATTSFLTTTDAPQVDFMCPGDGGLLGTVYTIVSDRTNYTGFVWVRPNDGRYVVNCNPSCSPVAGYSATLNSTHSALTIDSIRPTDAGTWNIADATVRDSAPVKVCQLEAVSIPQCTISSDQDTNSLEPGTQLTLTVEITDYYCSVEVGFDITTGDVTEELGMRHNVSGVTNLTIATNFSVDTARFGDVTLDFICHERRPLTCGGVKSLQKSPPQCIILSDKNTAFLEPGTNLTLAVGIRSFYCPQQAWVLLATGTVTDTLQQNQTMDDIIDVSLVSNFLVTTDRFGDVRINLVCGNIRTTLTCGGVNKLSEAATITSSTAETYTSASTAETPISPGNTAAATSTTPTTEGATDNTTGLAAGLSAMGVMIIIILLLVRYRRRVGEYFLSRRQKMHDAELQSEEKPKEKHTTVS